MDGPLPEVVAGIVADLIKKAGEILSQLDSSDLFASCGDNGNAHTIFLVNIL